MGCQSKQKWRCISGKIEDYKSWSRRSTIVPMEKWKKL